MKKTSSLPPRLSHTARAGSRDPAGTIGRNLEAFLLLELLQEPSYGYDLMKTLARYGFKRATEPGVVYRVLRCLEDSGAIRSKWSPQVSGPARRYYKITDNGRELLRRRTYHLKRQKDRIERLVEDYVRLTGDSLARAPAPEGFRPRVTAGGRRTGRR